MTARVSKTPDENSRERDRRALFDIETGTKSESFQDERLFASRRMRELPSLDSLEVSGLAKMFLDKLCTDHDSDAFFALARHTPHFAALLAYSRAQPGMRSENHIEAMRESPLTMNSLMSEVKSEPPGRLWGIVKQLLELQGVGELKEQMSRTLDEGQRSSLANEIEGRKNFPDMKDPVVRELSLQFADVSSRLVSLLRSDIQDESARETVGHILAHEFFREESEKIEPALYVFGLRSQSPPVVDLCARKLQEKAPDVWNMLQKSPVIQIFTFTVE